MSPDTTALIQLVKQLSAQQDRILDMQERHTAQLTAVAEEMAEIRGRLSVPQPNGCPGTCNALAEHLKRLEDDLEKTATTVADHRLLVAKVEGGWWMLTALCAVCSTLGGLIGWALSHFSK